MTRTSEDQTTLSHVLIVTSRVYTILPISLIFGSVTPEKITNKILNMTHTSLRAPTLYDVHKQQM